MIERVAVAGGRINAHVGERNIGSIAIGDVARLVVTRFASGLYHGEEPFVVLEDEQQALVVPYGVAGMRQLSDALVATYGGSKMLWLAECEGLPMAWRKRFLGLFPLFPIPRLAVHPRASVPHWNEQGPLPMSALPTSIGEHSNV